MFYLLTNFIDKLNGKKVLSKYNNFYFDNPKNNEIKVIENLLEKSFELSDISDLYRHKRLPFDSEVNNKDLFTIEQGIEKLLNKQKFGKDEIKNIIQNLNGNKKNIINFFAKNWVILRFNNKSLLEEHENLKLEYEKNGKNGFFLLDDEHIFTETEKKVVYYNYLISLLSDIDFKSFLLTTDTYDIKLFNPNVRYLQNIFYRLLYLFPSPDNDFVRGMFDFDIFYKYTQNIIEILDKKLVSKELDENLLFYIGSILVEIDSIKSDYTKLVRLISILEMLLTHNPNFNRFNVEDSITKQFILKTTICLYRMNKGIDLIKEKEKLKNIYNIRSNIVHGNFEEVKKYEKKMKKQNSDWFFDELIEYLYDVVKNILLIYIKEPKFVRFLKDN